MRRYSGNTHVLDMHREIARLKEQVHVLAKLHTKGFLNDAKYQEQTAGLHQKIAKLQKKLQQFIRSEDADGILQQMDMLVDFFAKREGMMVTFEEAFETLVDKPEYSRLSGKYPDAEKSRHRRDI